MKKSTLTKLLCLALLCLMIVPFIVSCGNKCTVYFDADGGECTEEERQVKEGQPIGKLPTPKKKGFVFTGWYDEGDTHKEDRITTRDQIFFDTVLVAGWEKDNNTIVVNFDVNGGTMEGSDMVYMDRGGAIGNNLPADPVHELGATFLGWYDQAGNRVTKVTKLNDDAYIVAKWTELRWCDASQSYNHQWSGWNYDDNEPTCTEAGKAVHVCLDCKYQEVIPGKEALGHDFATGWEFGLMEQSRTCDRCKRAEKITYENVSSTAVKEVKVTGNIYGTGNEFCLFNNDWDETSHTTFCCKDSGTLVVDLEFREPTKVDWVYVKGSGGYGYTFSVRLEGESTYTDIGNGSFSDVIGQFNLKGKVITHARFEMASAGNGNGYWQEIAFTQIPASATEE